MTLALDSDRPAGARRAVAFCCDERFLPFAAFAAAQVADLVPDRDFDICICTVRPQAPPPSLAPYGLRFCRVETGGLFDALRLDRRFVPEAYLRFALPLVMGGDYERILYLDSDVFVQGGDVRGLMGIDLGPHAVGAVRAQFQWRRPGAQPSYFKDFGLAPARCLNSGVMLIDCARFERERIRERCVAFGLEHGSRLIGHDQTLLNCVLHGAWAELAPAWNWQYSPKTALLGEMARVNVVHFIREAKPWDDPTGALAPRFADAMARFVARHFPDRPPVPVGSGRATNAGAVRALLWAQLLAHGRTAAFLARFPTELTVHP